MLAVIACNVLEAEVRHYAADLAQIRTLIFMPQGLHNEPARLQNELQLAVTAAEADPLVTAIALVYGLCSRGVENLRHDRCPLVIARAHDCVTLFLGDKERYATYLREHPGTYWYSPGWIKSHTPPGPERTEKLRAQYAEKFDVDDVDYLMEMEAHWVANYNRAAYVGLGIGETQKDQAYTQRCAACLGWDYDHVKGDPALLRALLAGEWDQQRFLVVPPRHVIRLTADETIIRAVPEDSP
ncbi:MAG: DUF1638 domain-containing protein [Opitutaceae bacterium]|jgi:hypothetical protein|nr:DUF1638 domain-containing protein [Opitutaceae bacterium]NBR59018.1 DUF1638 domain-containing protein [Opitutaceae bacterium]